MGGRLEGRGEGLGHLEDVERLRCAGVAALAAGGAMRLRQVQSRRDAPPVERLRLTIVSF